MTTGPIPTTSHFLVDITERIKTKQNDILRWLESQEESKELPLYSSVDIRNAGFKAAVVDTNIFPAGFNNLCEHGLADSVRFMREAIYKRVPDCKNILIVAEEHTRNTWYLENIRILQSIIEQAGFRPKIATFLSIQPAFCENANSVELETATGQTVRIHCFRKILSEYAAGRAPFDLMIMNNDLTTGIPQVLKESSIPIYPSAQAGWHSRLKSHHFEYTAELIHDFARILDTDPWFFSCLYAVAEGIDIHDEEDRDQLRQTASKLFKRIEAKYKEHQIKEKPYILIKADAGTYGMGILPIEDPDDIVHLNRRDRNKLHTGKSGQVIQRYLLQEGVPTIYNIEKEVSEVCIYQIENNLVGGFYRSHAAKGGRDNLNAQGMVFKKMCPHLITHADCGVPHDVDVFNIYRLLARIAAIAAQREIVHLEASDKIIK